MPSESPITPLALALAREASEVAGGADAVAMLEPPANAEFGDLATNVAMTLAKQARRNPREIADELAGRITSADGLAGYVQSAEVAGPGFINLTLSPAWFADAARAIAEAGDDYGRGQAEPRERILIEFVSCNPTGPPHVGHARQAAYGDGVARILEYAGHQVTREFYVNDWGRQMELFGASVAARYGQLMGLSAEVPEDGYQGEYVTAIAEKLRDEVGDQYRERVDPPDVEVLALFALRGKELMLATITEEIARFRVRFDDFLCETTLHEGGAVERGLEALIESGDAYEHDGALWFRTTAYGDEKDRVLRRSDGSTTYLAADVAYHLDKAGRGDDRLLDVLGADHHGYIARLRAVIEAGGHDPDMLEVPIVQLVSLTEGGEAKKMSKRAGTLVTLGELIDDIGVDAARFFLVQRSHETAFDLDLDVARAEGNENPVYYVQYAHARIAGILAQQPEAPADAGPPAELGPVERALLLQLALWPEVVREAERRRSPHRVAAYLMDLARDFHGFYHRCRVVGEAPEVVAFRLDLLRATRSVIAAGLDLIGVEAPDRM
ncbi:MAG: arginine--tRNA ligase [Actinobacteria bacterium]|nr:arginine--tRNA ligase [Actinomycetota bacterium]